MCVKSLAHGQPFSKDLYHEDCSGCCDTTPDSPPRSETFIFLAANSSVSQRKLSCSRSCPFSGASHIHWRVDVRIQVLAPFAPEGSSIESPFIFRVSPEISLDICRHCSGVQLFLLVMFLLLSYRYYALGQSWINFLHADLRVSEDPCYNDDEEDDLVIAPHCL